MPLAEISSVLTRRRPSFEMVVVVTVSTDFIHREQRKICTEGRDRVPKKCWAGRVVEDEDELDVVEDSLDELDFLGKVMSGMDGILHTMILRLRYIDFMTEITNSTCPQASISRDFHTIYEGVCASDRRSIKAAHAALGKSAMRSSQQEQSFRHEKSSERKSERVYLRSTIAMLK